MTAVVETTALRRAFAGRYAVDGVDLVLHRGECLALFGPNGAGKTTLLRLLAGLLRPTSGRATVAGKSLPGGAEARGVVGFISHHSMLYAALTPLENVEFAARLHGVVDPRTAARRVLSAMQADDRRDTPVRLLSRGLAQRVSIARATVHEPQVVLLDEPFSGLDEAGAAALTRMLQALKERGAALILVTHNVTEGLALATHAAIMRQGRFVRMEGSGGIETSSYAASYRALFATAHDA